MSQKPDSKEPVYDGCSLQAVGNAFGITNQRASQLERRAIRKLWQVRARQLLRVTASATHSAATPSPDKEN